jgi:hypothetical protein
MLVSRALGSRVLGFDRFTLALTGATARGEKDRASAERGIQRRNTGMRLQRQLQCCRKHRRRHEHDGVHRKHGDHINAGLRRHVASL